MLEMVRFVESSMILTADKKPIKKQQESVFKEKQQEDRKKINIETQSKTPVTGVFLYCFCKTLVSFSQTTHEFRSVVLFLNTEKYFEKKNLT